jgi:broad specificity phosphatase PhoE
LSSLGHQQAQEVGKYLDSWMDERGFATDDITWLSSPFLRCLQTSDDALNSFQKANVDTLQINPEYSIFEWDGHGGEWHQDLPEVEERKHYFPRLNMSYESCFVPDLPGMLPFGFHLYLSNP